MYGNFGKSYKYNEKFTSKLIYNKTYLKAKKIFITKESFHCFYIPVILLDSVYRTDGDLSESIFGKFIPDDFWKV